MIFDDIYELMFDDDTYDEYRIQMLIFTDDTS